MEKNKVKLESPTNSEGITEVRTYGSQDLLDLVAEYIADKIDAADASEIKEKCADGDC